MFYLLISIAVKKDFKYKHEPATMSVLCSYTFENLYRYLSKKIRKILRNNDNNIAIGYNKKIFKGTDVCYVCLDDVSLLQFLHASPCGHKICMYCVHEMGFYKPCAFCRQQVYNYNQNILVGERIIICTVFTNISALMCNS